MRSDRLLSLAAGIAITLFVVAFVGLFDARMQSGDIYPVYSSLRSDAGGTKAYYESIEQLEGVHVARGFEPLEAIPRRAWTVFLLGISPQALAANSAKYLKLSAEQNRVVIGLPVCSTAVKSVGKLWDLSWECVKRTPAPDHYVFTHVDPKWSVIASDENGAPVAVEQVFRNGSFVVVSDTYALTNEGLLRNRDIQLLARLVGKNTHVLFDEHHLGVAESPGVISLARQYRLHGFVAGLLLIALLFIWRNASSFLPRIAEQFDSDEVSGRAASSGLTNLLGRAISKSELLNICAAEWRRSQGRRVSDEEIARVMQIASSPQAAKTPAESYREISQLLNERRRR